MATTFVDYTGDGNATKAFSFPSYKVEDIKVEVDNVIKTVSTHYNITSYTTTGGGNVVFTSGNIPTSPAAIRIFRDTDVDSAKATYTAGSAVKADDLNNNHTQLLYAAQEEQNQTILTSDIKDGAVTTAKIKADNITSALIADDQINSEHYVDGSIDTAHIADSQITTAKIAADAVNGTKIADDSINSEHYVDGSIDTAHIADSQVTTAKIANDAINGTKLADNSVNTEHYVDYSIDSIHIKDNRITTAKIVDANVTTAKIADDAVTAAKIAANNVTATELGSASVTTPKIGSNAVTTAKILDSNVTTAKIADSNVTTAKLASNAVTTAKITDANVTTVKIADSNVTLAKLASDLKQTAISDSDTQLPTSGAVVDYVAAQLEPFGGFEAIANEVSFPNTQPASGVAISIADAAGIVVSGSGSSTTGRTVGGSTVTINNIPSNFHSSTVATGIRFIVTSTGSGQVYNYHKATLPESDLVSLSGDINDFNERYRVGSSNPTSNNDSGDLFFNTATGKMLVFNGTSSAFEEVQSIGNFFISTLSPAFDGTTQNFTITDAPTNVQQVILVINGVVQKPNAGTSTPSEGFALDGSTIKLAAAPATGSTYHAVVMGSTVNIGTPSDGTVTTAKLASDAVTTAKIAANAVTQGKIASDSISTGLLQSNSVTTAKITDANVTTAKIADANVTTVKIADDAITNAKLADDSVNSGQIADAAIDTVHIGPAQITSSLLANNSVVTDRIADANITTAKIADDAVTQAKIAANAIGAGEINNGSITSVELADGAVPAAKLATDAVTTVKIAASNVTTAKIADSNVTTAKIADDAVTADKLANTAVSAGTYGSATAIPAITVDAQGRVTGASTNTVSAGSAVNYIINGNMSVAQRYAGTPDDTNGWASTDRFRLEYTGTSANPTQAQITLGIGENGTTPLSAGIRNAFRITNGNQGSAATGAMIQMGYAVLAKDLLNSGWTYDSASSYLTLSYYVRSSVAGTFYGRIYTALGSGKALSWSTGALTANTWKRVTVQIPGNPNFSIASDLNTNTEAFFLYFNAYAGTSKTDSSASSSWINVSGSNQYPDYANADWYTTNGATMDFTGVQLEIGQTASDFVCEPYMDTFRKCQQYYQVICSDNYEILAIGFQYYSGSIFMSIPLPVQMIYEPTLIALSGSVGAYTYERVHNNQALYTHQITLDSSKTGHSRVSVYMAGDASRSGQAVRCAAHWTSSNAHKFVAVQAELS